MKEEKIGPGKFVAYTYKVYNDANGELLFEVPTDAPDTFVYGVTQDIVPGLAAALDGLGAGDKFGVTLPPEAAFGQRFDENILELDKSLFMRDGQLAEEVVEGAVLPMMTDNGMRINGRVLKVGDTITMDFNHPLAGLTVRYDGEVLQVRDATPDELQPRCGGCGGGCGSCGDGGCGDGGCSDGSCSGCK